MGTEFTDSESKIKKIERSIGLLNKAELALWGVHNLAAIILLTQPGIYRGIGIGMLLGELGVLTPRIVNKLTRENQR
jgi:hypothetical protein